MKNLEKLYLTVAMVAAVLLVVLLIALTKAQIDQHWFYLALISLIVVVSLIGYFQPSRRELMASEEPFEQPSLVTGVYDPSQQQDEEKAHSCCGQCSKS